MISGSTVESTGGSRASRSSPNPAASSRRSVTRWRRWPATGPSSPPPGARPDGRFVAPTGAEVVELGPVNASIHSVDERVLVDDLERLSEMYERVIARLLTS